MIDEANKMFLGQEQAMIQQLPMDRLCMAEEIADVVLFLCSPKAGYVTGCNMVMDWAMGLSLRTA